MKQLKEQRVWVRLIGATIGVTVVLLLSGCAHKAAGYINPGVPPGVTEYQRNIIIGLERNGVVVSNYGNNVSLSFPTSQLFNGAGNQLLGENLWMLNSSAHLINSFSVVRVTVAAYNYNLRVARQQSRQILNYVDSRKLNVRMVTTKGYKTRSMNRIDVSFHFFTKKTFY